MRVAALLPARDEEARIGEVMARLGRALPAVNVWVVDSGSRDRTAALATSLGARVVRQEGVGYPGAITTGLRALSAEGYDAVLLIDADGQHPPEDAPRLLAALESADWVIGSRAGTGSPGTWDRRAGNALLALAVRLAAGGDLRDVTSGYQALGPRALAVLTEGPPPPVADANLRARALRRGLRVREVPVRMATRAGGVSMHDGLAGARNLAASMLAVLVESARPLP